MVNILHLSDFHLSDEAGWVFSESKLHNLKDAIENTRIDYLVFTGDIIDAASIFRKIRKIIDNFADPVSKTANFKDLESLLQSNSMKDVRDLIISEYNTMLEAEYTSAYEKAACFWNEFLDYLDIPRSKVLICPGNHDVMEQLSPNAYSPKCSQGAAEIELNTMKEARLRHFISFCEKLQITGSIENSCKLMEDACFFTINTNFRMYRWKPNDKACINCDSINNELMLVQTYRDKNIPIITISHEPLDSICENVIFDYVNNGNDETVYQKIERISDLLLNGDKHTVRDRRGINTVEFTCGNSLISNQIQYKLIRIIEKKKDGFSIESENIFYDANSWKKTPALDVCNEIYQKSKGYIKELSFKFVCGTNVSVLQSFSEVREKVNKERLDLTWKFFQCGMHIFPRQDASSIYKESHNLYDLIWDEFKKYDEFCVKGNSGVGKSTLLGAFFLQSLLDYACGNSYYLPFYYNIQFSNCEVDKKASQSNGMGFYDSISNNLMAFIEDSYKFAAEKKATPLIIIDGLNEKKIWNNREDDELIEGKMISLLDRMDDYYADSFSNNAKHLLGIDVFTDLDLANVGVLLERYQKGIRLDGVMVSLMPRYKKRFTDMAEAYFSLFNNKTKAKDNASLFYSMCMNLRVIDVDYHFLETNANTVLKEENRINNSIVRLLENKAAKMFSKSEQRYVDQCAYELEVKGINYNDYISQHPDDQISYSSFAKIYEKSDIRKFLVARYMIRVFFKEWSDTQYLQSLDIFIDRRIMSYIKLLIDYKNSTNDIANFYQKYDSEKTSIDGIGLCNLAYLFSYFGFNGAILFNATEKYDYEINELMEHGKAMSEIMAAKESNISPACSYIESLIKDSKKREFIRRYQRLYYGDLDSRKWKVSTEDYMQKGFDYFRCFQILSVKISNSLSANNRYKLLEYDLFTICDLTIARLQKPSFEYANSIEIKTLFYDSSYPARREILECLIFLLDKYINEFHNASKVSCTGESPLIHHYFEYAKSEFKKVLELYDNKKKNEKILLDTCARQYSFLHMYLNSERLGWRIRSKQTNLEEPEFNALARGNKIFTTDGELVDVERRDAGKGDCDVITESESNKVASVMLIAQLFLPDNYEMLPKVDAPAYCNIDLSAYNKSLIMALLLLRYCGKGQAGDFTPAASLGYREKLLKEQHDYTCNILMPFILQGTSNLGEVFRLINQDYVSENKQRVGDINLLIATEIEMIQLEYQYYLTNLQYFKRHNVLSYFSQERKLEFEKDFEGKINYCKFIEKALIKDNPDFRSVFDSL